MANPDMIPGNQLWKKRKTHGKPKKFKTPESLWKAACKYFVWCEENPIWEQVLVTNRGSYRRVNVPHMRAMTIGGLCFFLGISNVTYTNYRNRKGFDQICADIDAVIYEQKLTGAAAGMLNPMVIIRELGLKEKAELTGKDGQPFESTKYIVEFVDAAKKDSST